MITLQLTCKASSETFLVATYHMPCAFRVPEVMVVHAALAAQHLHSLAGAAVDSVDSANARASQQVRGGEVRGREREEPSLRELMAATAIDSSPTHSPRPRPGRRSRHHLSPSPRSGDSVITNTGRLLPYVLAGDFNFPPGSPAYRLLTSGSLGNEVAGAVRIPPATQGDTWCVFNYHHLEDRLINSGVCVQGGRHQSSEKRVCTATRTGARLHEPCPNQGRTAFYW